MLRYWLLDVHEPLPLETADVSSMDSVTRLLSPGFYTTFRTYSTRLRILDPDAHLDRLYKPARRLGIRPVIERNLLRSQLASLLAEFPSPEARLRLILTTREAPGSIYVLIEPLETPSAKVYTHGVKVITTTAQRVRPWLKSTEFIEESQSARRQLASSMAYEGLIIRNGRIMEGLTSNFFYIVGMTLGTAHRGVLGGVTRRQVLCLGAERGMPMENHALKISRLTAIDEAFLTSSSRGVVPIVQIDDRQIGNGRVGEWTRILMADYNKNIERRAELILPADTYPAQKR